MEGKWCRYCLSRPCTCVKTLFDEEYNEEPVPGGYARNSDPDTSKEAADAIRGTKRLASLQAQIVQWVTQRPGCTMKEHIEYAGGGYWSLSPRFAELRAAGLIHSRGKKKCRVTGRSSLQWWPGPEEE